MVFAGSGITYSELKEMDLREYREAVEARLLWQGEWNPNRKKEPSLRGRLFRHLRR